MIMTTNLELLLDLQSNVIIFILSNQKVHIRNYTLPF